MIWWDSSWCSLRVCVRVKCSSQVWDDVCISACKQEYWYAWHDSLVRMAWPIHALIWLAKEAHCPCVAALSPQMSDYILGSIAKMVFTDEGDSVGACICQCIWITNYLYASRTVKIRHKLWHEQIPTFGVRVRWWVKEVPRIRAPHIHHNHFHTVLTCAYITYGYFLETEREGRTLFTNVHIFV